MKRELVLYIALIASTGCAQVMAAVQPSPLDRKVLLPGAERGAIVGTLGAPRATEEHPKQEIIRDTYRYTDGGLRNAWGSKAGRIVLYTAGDVFTLFLTQILWIPAELALRGTEYSATVEYVRRPSDQRWIAHRVTESKEGGNRETTVMTSDRAVSSPPATVKPATTVTGQTTGTCFAVDPNGHVLTAHHLLEDARAIHIHLADGRSAIGTIDRISRGADLALLDIGQPTPDFLPVDGSGAPDVGDRVFTIGFPAADVLGPQAKFSEGAIAGLTGPAGDATLLQITIPVQVGNAGGPLVNEFGEIVGIITRATAFESLSEADGVPTGNAGLAINAAYAVPLLGLAANSTPSSTRDEVRRARAAVCRIEVIRTEHSKYVD